MVQIENLRGWGAANQKFEGGCKSKVGRGEGAKRKFCPRVTRRVATPLEGVCRFKIGGARHPTDILECALE